MLYSLITHTFIINTNFYYIAIDTGFDTSHLYNNSHNNIFDDFIDTKAENIFDYINHILKPNYCPICYQIKLQKFLKI